MSDQDEKKPKWVGIRPGKANPRRLKITGGWLVRIGTTEGDSLTFIPDPKHENPPEALVE